MRSIALKRMLDLIVGGVAVVLLLPVLLVVALLVRLLLGSPVLFSQQRPGLAGRPFVMLKFRTMSDARDSNGELLPDQLRLGRFGQWLRASSVDELPELLNVLAGDMSLVGPRPLLMDYLPLYSPVQRRRHEVRPGLTGWAQVNGRNAITWEEKFALDVWYVDNWSLFLDLRIMLMTVGKVVTGAGVSQQGQATMERFHGTVRHDQNETAG